MNTTVQKKVSYFFPTKVEVKLTDLDPAVAGYTSCMFYGYHRELDTNQILEESNGSIVYAGKTSLISDSLLEVLIGETGSSLKTNIATFPVSIYKCASARETFDFLMFQFGYPVYCIIKKM